ncbi:MAG: DivIVA domain-containing protein [Bacilli bacterium]|nr:DivIVA domain-containing protein [Bacilli bacterium]
MKKFDKSFNGYNVEQVNAFVDEVIVQVDDMIQKMKEKDLEIDRLNKELVHYKDMEATINRAVMIAQDAANKYKENSLNESDLILVEAKKNANRIINDALLKAEHLEEDAARIRRNIITYKRRIKSLLDQQADLIDDLDKVDLD